jgi:AAHS family 4-hydroxybenzoate transporter-like MFS transporter
MNKFVPSNLAVTVSEIVEGAGFRRPLLMIIGLCFLLMICDSYDVAALSFAAPVLIKQWGIPPADLGLIFSTGLFGLLVGSILFGWVGDRFGRKRAMIVGGLAFAVLTAATGLASSETALLLLRFLATIGLGGAVPNAVALTTEFSPRARRVTAVGVIFAGYSVGGIAAGLSASYLIGEFGWQAMFFVGGALSLMTTAAFLFLPESLPFLAGTPGREAEAARVAAFLRPELRTALHGHIVPDGHVLVGQGRLADLFAGSLRVVTPVMWLIYVANSMTVFTLSSWMPVAVESVGFPRAMAATATALMYAGSAIGGVIGGRFADRLGLSAVVAMALLAFPAVAALGMLGGAAGLLLPVSFLAGCFAFGGQTCLHGIVGTLYPTSIRANGVGWAIGIAKIGSIAGPFIAGLLLPLLSGGQLFLAAACPLLLVAALALVLRIILSSAGPARDAVVVSVAE